jgi:hypothetical protein
MTPSGTMSSTSEQNSRMESGVSSEGFSTEQLPAARAGPSFQEAINSGTFHGVICPTTP